MIDSALMANRTNGLAKKRSVQRQSEGSKKRDVRAIVMTDSVLDHLVHLHVLPTDEKNKCNAISLNEFLEILYTEYGFCIDKSPAGLSISNELLRTNRSILEGRLRDLGLLIGVNDAESMKTLKPRFFSTANR